MKYWHVCSPSNLSELFIPLMLFPNFKTRCILVINAHVLLQHANLLLVLPKCAGEKYITNRKQLIDHYAYMYIVSDRVATAQGKQGIGCSISRQGKHREFAQNIENRF